jgi:hypothetical protein
MDIWDYFHRKEREIRDMGVSLETPRADAFSAAPDSDIRGRLLFNLGLTENAYLQVLERVVIRGNVAHRDRYAYTLVVDGLHVYGWERHKTHDPVVHEHEGSGRVRKASEPIALRRVVDLAWEMLSSLAEELDEDESAA